MRAGAPPIVFFAWAIMPYLTGDVAALTLAETGRRLWMCAD